MQLTHIPPDPDIALVREALESMRDTGDRPGMYEDASAALAVLNRLKVRIAVLERELKQDRKVYYAPTPAENTDFEWKTQEC